MAKCTVTYRCGHEGTVELFGKVDERVRKINWLGTCDCWKCRKSKEEAERVTSDNYFSVEVPYKDYKNKYMNCSTISSSYNPETKCIKILVPKSINVSADDSANEIIFGDVLELIPEKIVSMNPDETLSNLHRCMERGPMQV